MKEYLLRKYTKKMNKFILASASPRRKELLAQIGIEFDICASNADESTDETVPALLVEQLSLKKAEGVKESPALQADTADAIIKPVVIIGADTIVACDDKILGKPADKENAREMITLIQGRTHQVYTGVTLIRVSDKVETITFHEKTDVYVCPMQEDDIERYMEYKTSNNQFEWADKAGAYAIQGYFARFVSGIDGDYNNVVGLPVGRLYQEMKKAGWIL